VIVQVQVNYVRSTIIIARLVLLVSCDLKLALIVGALLCSRGISYLFSILSL